MEDETYTIRVVHFSRSSDGKSFEERMFENVAQKVHENHLNCLCKAVWEEDVLPFLGDSDAIGLLIVKEAKE